MIWNSCGCQTQKKPYQESHEYYVLTLVWTLFVVLWRSVYARAINGHRKHEFLWARQRRPTNDVGHPLEEDGGEYSDVYKLRSIQSSCNDMENLFN